ncbi:MAG TPA: four helix bundle protein [Gemmatimonadales bacterium]|nr:four helix bundle protein [Gemmatimonadales bacterium]
MTTPVTREVLQRRTRTLAVDAIRLIGDLPRTLPADVIGRQLVRSATSVAANYRSACRARSRRDFIAKMGIVEEETDETAFWLELLDECRLVPTTRIMPLSREAGELLAITVASIRTARMGSGASRANPQSTIRNPQCS